MENQINLLENILFFKEPASDLSFYFEDDDVDEIHPIWYFDVLVTGEYYKNEDTVIQLSFDDEDSASEWWEKITNSQEPVAVEFGDKTNGVT